ncbi:MAG: hypothetical protein HQL46_05120 [Gammaproteobacteria bacterium]|nr:hypothetical protein [Gammaproteobacteria bacterium]
MTQILSDVYHFYKQNFSSLVSYIIPVSLLITVISMFAAQSMDSTDEMEQIKVLLIMNFIFNPIYLGGLIYLLSQLSNSNKPKLSQCLSFGLSKWTVLFAVSIVYGLLTGMGFFLFVLPGIWIFIRLILAPFLVAINNVSPLDAVKESFILTRNEFWNILGLTSLVFLSLILIQQLLLNHLPDNAWIKVIGSVFGDVLWSFLTVIWYRYYDLLKNGN